MAMPRQRIALLLIDIIDYFPEGEELLRSSTSMTTDAVNHQPRALLERRAVERLSPLLCAEPKHSGSTTLDILEYLGTRR